MAAHLSQHCGGNEGVHNSLIASTVLAVAYPGTAFGVLSYG